jgi:rubrerythrin
VNGPGDHKAARGANDAAVTSVKELMAYAVALETEAEQRYRDLADQMDVHNNLDVATLFRTLAHYEAEHAKRLDDQAEEMGARELPSGRAVWPDAEPPENVGHLDAHYLMTPAQALRLALAAERRALAFYQEVAAISGDGPLRSAADAMAAEEEQHVRMVESMLARYPDTPADWNDDPDPPVEAD